MCYNSLMSFSTVINCMDGRIQVPVVEFVQAHFGAPYVDMITEAGPAGILARRPHSNEARSIFHRVDISIQAHGSRQIAVVAHHDCAGNPVPPGEQAAHLAACLKLLGRKYPRMERIGLWVDEKWSVQLFPG